MSWSDVAFDANFVANVLGNLAGAPALHAGDVELGKSASHLVVRLRFDLVEGGAAALNFGDDVLGGGFPDEWLGIVVPVFCPGGDCGGEVGDAAECAAAQAFVGEFFEPAFDQVQPGTRGRGVVQVPV